MCNNFNFYATIFWQGVCLDSSKWLMSDRLFSCLCQSFRCDAQPSLNLFTEFNIPQICSELDSFFHLSQVSNEDDDVRTCQQWQMTWTLSWCRWNLSGRAVWQELASAGHQSMCLLSMDNMPSVNTQIFHQKFYSHIHQRALAIWLVNHLRYCKKQYLLACRV